MIDALVLCGGRGSRLVSSIGAETPKFLAELASGHRVADEVITWLRAQPSVRFIVLAPGLQRERILAANLPVDGVDLWPYATGTADAVRRALKARYARADLLTTSSILVVNGDTLLDVDLSMSYKVHHASRAFATSVYARDHRERVAHCGLRFLSRQALDTLISSKHIDIDVFLRDHPTLVFESSGRFVDAGTPEGYTVARNRLTNKLTESTIDVGINDRSDEVCRA